MKVTVVSQNKEKIKPSLKGSGFVIDDKNPEFVVSFGGDGTLMKAEELFPGLPKIILRDSAICKKCSKLSNEIVLEKIKNGQYRIDEVTKLQAAANGENLSALNDIVVHNADPRHAIRYHVSINNALTHHEIIGDGIIAATPFGATGYYRSITHSYFDTGIGLAFNNSIEQSDHMILSDNTKIELEIARGPAIVYADNQDKTITLETGAKITIKKADHKAKIVMPLE